MRITIYLLLLAGLAACSPPPPESTPEATKPADTTKTSDKTAEAPKTPVDWSKVPEAELVSMQIDISGMA